MRTLALLCLLILAACAGPRAAPPAASAVVPPESWRTPTPPISEAALETAWWQSFGDPVLADVVAQALANNVDVALAAARVEEARAQFRLAKGAELPGIGVGVGGGRERFLNAFGVGTYQTAGKAEIEASYDLDLFGRLSNQTKAARAALLASAAAQDTVRLAVASSAASGYIGLRALDARLVVLRQTLEARAGSLQVQRRREHAGYASRLELEQAESEYHATAQQIPAAELALRRQEDALSVLLGEPPQGLPRGVALDSLKTADVPISVPSALLRRRPDIAQAELQITAADRTLDAARAAFMPTIELSASGSLVASTLIGDPVALFSLGGSVLQPIFEGGRLRAAAAVATSRRDQAAFAYRRTALNAFRDVEDALATVRLTADQERALVAQRDVLSRTLALAKKRYRAGYATYLDQLDAQRGLLSAELALVQSRADRLAATVSLYQALGGGWTRDQALSWSGSPATISSTRSTVAARD